MLDDKIFTFNSYMKQKFGARVARIALHTGFNCPWNRCVFCRRDSFSPDITADMSKPGWQETLAKSMDFLKKRYKNEFFAAYFQSGTATFGDEAALGGFFRQAGEIPGVVAEIFSTRPDYLTQKEIGMILRSVPESIDEIWIELGLQSTNDKSLKLLNRGHDAASYFRAVENVEKYGNSRIKIAPHIILGIPGETIDDMLSTVRESTQSEVVRGIKIHHLQIHRGTELEKIYAEAPFKLLSVDEYIEIISEIISLTPKEIVFFRLFTTTPAEYLVAPVWQLNTQEALAKLENYLEKNNIHQSSAL